MTEILQNKIPHNPLEPQRLPGIAPLPAAAWLTPDDAFSAQMTERERLLFQWGQRRRRVVGRRRREGHGVSTSISCVDDRVERL